MKVYCVSIEDDDSGCVDWWGKPHHARAHYLEALGEYPDDEINLFEIEVPDDTTKDEITSEVDAAMWDRSYTPIRWRKGRRHSAKPHAAVPTD
jgi:hypothetical protein